MHILRQVVFKQITRFLVVFLDTYVLLVYNHTEVALYTSQGRLQMMTVYVKVNSLGLAYSEKQETDPIKRRKRVCESE